MKMRVWLGVVAVVYLSACESEGSKNAEEVSRPEPAPAAEGAVVTGRVRLADGFTLPSYAAEDMERKLLLTDSAGVPSVCSPPKKGDRTPVTQTEEGYLTGLLVAASDFTGAKPRPPKVHKVSIDDCRLNPRLVVAMKGDSLELRNEVDFPFMPMFGAAATGARTLMPGQVEKANLDRAGVESILCTYTAPCGRTDVVTLYHPIYTITDGEGRFRLTDFPTDQEVTLNVWHPLFQEANIKVSVGKGQTKELDIVITPKERFKTEAAQRGAHDDLEGTALQRTVAAQEGDAPDEAPEEQPASANE